MPTFLTLLTKEGKLQEHYHGSTVRGWAEEKDVQCPGRVCPIRMDPSGAGAHLRRKQEGRKLQDAGGGGAYWSRGRIIWSLTFSSYKGGPPQVGGGQEDRGDPHPNQRHEAPRQDALR